MNTIIRTLMKSNLLVILLMLGFMACDKRDIVEEDLNGFDVLQQNQLIFERIRNATDPKAEIRKINEEHGRYVDEKGDVYFTEADYKAITQARENPNARSGIIYNKLEIPNSLLYGGVVSYWDDGAWHYLAALHGTSAFVTCPTSWTLCNSYNRYLWQVSCSQFNPANCTQECGKVYASFLDGTTVKDNDSWDAIVNQWGINDVWQMRIRNSLATGIFPNRAYVLNGDCNGNNTGAGCGFSESGN